MLRLFHLVCKFDMLLDVVERCYAESAYVRIEAIQRGGNDCWTNQGSEGMDEIAAVGQGPAIYIVISYKRRSPSFIVNLNPGVSSVISRPVH